MKLISLFLLLICLNVILCDVLEKQDRSKKDTNPILSLLLPLFNDLINFIASQVNWGLFLPSIIKVTDLITQVVIPPPELPVLDQNIWWGDEKDGAEDESISPYEIQFKDDRLQTLLYKLKYRENFTEPLKKAAMTYGMNTNFLNKILDYWLHEYDFVERQKRMNSYPQFITKVQGLDIHFIHVKPDVNKKIVPLLMLHGWPVNNMEYYYVIPKLMEASKDSDFVFEIIAPSLPGFGYSQGTSKIGLAPYQIGIIFKNLMKRLGFDKFYIHGGDFGEAVGSNMAVMYQDDILGFHTNLPFSYLPQTLMKQMLGALYPPAVVKPKYEKRMYPLFSRFYYIITKLGYFHMQATFPDTIGISLFDSPSGLAAWILTIMTWTSDANNIFHDDGRLLKTYNIDDLLDILTIIWDSECIMTSTRIYAEYTAVFQDPVTLKILWSPTKVPYAAIKFRHEIIYQPNDFLRDKYKNLVHATTVDYGGHFAAHENPDILAKDIWEAISTIESRNY